MDNSSIEERRVLTKDDIFAAEDITTEEVYVPEWGGVVYVKTLSGSERDELEKSIFSAGEADPSNLRAKLVAMATVDKEGNRLFTFADAERLGKKSARALDRVFSVAQRLSGMLPQDVQAMTENLSAGQSADSISG